MVAANETYPGLWFMLEEGKLTRISVGDPSKVTTPRGIGVGAAAATVRRAYGRTLKAEPHLYESLPAEYLTYWTVPKKRRPVRDGHQAARATIHAGTESIQYVEGCA